MIPLEDPTTLSLLFHLNSEPWLNDEAYRGAAMNQELKVPAGIIAEVPLPEPADSMLMELLENRRSCREFARREMPLEHLSALLAAGYGAIAPARFGGQTAFLRRTVPSAGQCFAASARALSTARTRRLASPPVWGRPVSATT